MGGKTIEDIILQHDGRNMTALRPHLPERYATEAAQLLLDQPGRVLIVTGFYILTAGAPETDGPPGAVAIGNALDDLNYEVAYVTDSASFAVMSSITRAEHRVIEFPIADHRESSEFASKLLRDEAPSALVAIERCGYTADGSMLNFLGLNISDHNAKIDHLFEQHPHTVGIGDGGNEIGMGNLKDVIPNYDKLPKSPCVTPVAKLVIASVSNWGGYGLVAALSELSGRNLLPSVEEEMAWLDKTVDAGAVDGVSAENKPWADGFSPEENAVCLRELHAYLGERGV